MTRRLKEGRHPDTDPNFWNGYTERPAPGLPTMSVPDAYNTSAEDAQWLSLLTIIGIPVLVVVVLVIRKVRARRRKAGRKDEMSAESL